MNRFDGIGSGDVETEGDHEARKTTANCHQRSPIRNDMLNLTAQLPPSTNREPEMKLYYAPCVLDRYPCLARGDRKALRARARQPARTRPIQAPFTGVSPERKVPALERDDGSVLTEFPSSPDGSTARELAAEDDEADTRAMEAMEYAVGTMHGQALPAIP